MAPKYSINGSTWVDLPAGMLAGLYEGSFELVYPRATGYTLTGLPCAAYGLPTVEFKSTRIPRAGAACWLGLFAVGALWATVYLDVWSPTHDRLVNAYGHLEYPTWERVVTYGGSARYYEGFTFKMTASILTEAQGT